MKYKVRLTWSPNTIDDVTETVEATDEDEAQGIAVSFASAIHGTDNDQGMWIVEEVTQLEETDVQDSYTPYAQSSDDELSLSYSPYVVSLSQNADNGTAWTSMGYTSYGDFSNEISFVVSGGEAGSVDSSTDTQTSESEEYQPYLTASSEDNAYVPYSSVSTPAETNQSEPLTASQVAGYTALSAPPQFKAACSYHRTLENGYLPYKSSWIVAVKPGQTITV